MFRRALVTTALAFVAAAPLAAQNSADPDKKVEGGALPAGWSGRTDRPNAKLADAKFTTMGSGYHVTSGPAAIYWNAAQNTTGPFKASATFAQTKAPAHPEAYGLFFMGKKLDAADQDYAYFLVRGDGKVMVKHRAGADVHTILDWTDNAAVHKQDAAGKATNTLSVDASKPDSVRLLVNGTQVAALPGSHLGSTDGAVGLRVNHNLDVHISDFSVTPGGEKLGVTKKDKKGVKKAVKKAAKG
jgi:hypothetical protein